MTSDCETEALLERADAGDPHALGELLERHRERLLQIVSFRMDARVKPRVDPADVVQDAFVEATHRVTQQQRDARLPVFLWLRLLTLQCLAVQHRRHLGAQARDADREVSIFTGPLPQATSAVIAAQLLGGLTSPSQAAIRMETRLAVEERLNQMDATDREVLVLRHFEKLSNHETARVLGLQPSAASNRFIRALKKLKTQLQEVGLG
ncbi:MAG: sigma-70 family RNA polymerase sigma factor [Planctomycetaceae bacterium]|nr:sigma-70 family RNA polymerase sigma factor [Planctomycetaceae bacterium]